MEQLSCAPDGTARKIAAHTLKGSAQGVGAHDVANKAQALEQMAENGDTAAWNRALGELESAFECADSFITNLS
ncbi:MAG: Hpt domain-containing protein [Rhizobiales bacterium]|nr:Hpt domain-containing protein [Hyphomicrobiales bacterium]